MRIAINVTRESDPRVIEEDVEFAIGHAITKEVVWSLPQELEGQPEFSITEQDTGCFTVDTETPMSQFPDGFVERVKALLESETGAEVTTEVFDWDRGF